MPRANIDYLKLQTVRIFLPHQLYNCNFPLHDLHDKARNTVWFQVETAPPVVVPFKTDAVALLELFNDHDVLSEKHISRAAAMDRYLMGPHWHQWDGTEHAVKPKEDVHDEDGYQQVS